MTLFAIYLHEMTFFVERGDKICRCHFAASFCGACVQLPDNKSEKGPIKTRKEIFFIFSETQPHNLLSVRSVHKTFVGAVFINNQKRNSKLSPRLQTCEIILVLEFIQGAPTDSSTAKDKTWPIDTQS